MHLTTQNKHLHPITARIPDYTMDTFFQQGIDSQMLDSAMAKTLDTIKATDFPSLGIHQASILLILLFPETSPTKIADKLFKEMDQRPVSRDYQLFGLIPHYFLAGKIDEIEKFLDQHPATKAQLFSVQVGSDHNLYFSHISLFMLMAGNINVETLEKYLPSHLNLYKQLREITNAKDLASAYEEGSEQIGSYCSSCSVFSKIVEEIPLPIKVYLKLFARFPADFDKHFNRTALLEQFLTDNTANTEDLYSLLVIINFDTNMTYLRQQDFVPTLHTKLADMLDQNIKILQTAVVGTQRTHVSHLVLMTLAAINKLILIDERRSNLIASTNIIDLLKSAAKDVVVNSKIRKQCALILKEMITSTANDADQSVRVRNCLGTDYQFYMDLHANFHHFQFFQMKVKENNIPIFPPEIMTIIGDMLVDLRM